MNIGLSQQRDGGLVGKVNLAGQASESVAVNYTALELINQLHILLGVIADFETTRGISTKIYDINSGKALYNVKLLSCGMEIANYKKADSFRVRIYPISKKSEEYLRKIVE